MACAISLWNVPVPAVTLAPMAELPSGAITFLFTDIEGSTRLLKQLRERYALLLADHQRLLRAAFAAHGGHEIDTQGDSFFVAFASARDAVVAAVEGQLALLSHSWPDGVEVKVRMGLHTGQAVASEGRYTGLAVHRAARICAAGHGGQVLVSQATQTLLEDEEEEDLQIFLRDLGEQRLKDLDRPVRLYQAEGDGLPETFPPIRSEAELAQAAEAPRGSMEFRLLGPLEVRAASGPIPLGGEKQRALLALLLLNANRVVSRERLIDELWGEDPPETAVTMVQVYVSRLRKVLPAGSLVTRSPGYVVEVGDDELDLSRFERLRAEARGADPEKAARLYRGALELWGGPVLAEFDGEPFARVERRRLEELHMATLEERIEADLALGRHDELIGELEALSAEHPDRERLRGQLMLALYRGGRHSEALEHFSHLRVRLRDGLGLEPSTQLRELQRRILQQDPSLSPAPGGERSRSVLPVPPKRLLGRERELREVVELLLRDDVRLLVLTGAGGSGKTRLALEAAHAVASSFANGAAFVDLAPLRRSEEMPAAIARTLGRALEDNSIDALARELPPSELLLLLDNTEQLGAVGPQLAELLALAPHLTLLVTSRVVLQVSGERVYPVQPLSDEDAVALFYERARDAAHQFEPAESEKPAILGICRRLDGLPLAIELAASRIRALTPSEILERLEARIPLLTSGSRDLPLRQQTLNATLEWSLDLLDEQARLDLCRLSVFAGGCSLQAGQAVTGTSIDTLTNLVDHNLLQHHTTQSGSRYTMLETIREHERGRLSEVDEDTSIERRRAEYFAAIGEAAAELVGAARELDLLRLQPDVENVRAALRWAIDAADGELALRLGWAAHMFQVPVQEVGRSLDAALSLPGEVPPIVRARALHELAAVAVASSDFGRSRELWEQALVLYRSADDARGTARALAGLGLAASYLGDQVAARDLYASSLELYRELGDSDGEWIVTINLGELERGAGDYKQASELLERAVRIATADGDLISVAMSLHSLADVALDQGDLTLASERCGEALSISWELAGGRRIACWCLAGLAFVAAERGEVERAGLLWGAVEELEEQFGAAIAAPARQRYRAPVDALQSGELEAAIGRGRVLPFDKAVEYALTFAGAG